jgi:hypothetical protein
MYCRMILALTISLLSLNVELSASPALIYICTILPSSSTYTIVVTVFPLQQRCISLKFIDSFRAWKYLMISCSVVIPLMLGVL